MPFVGKELVVEKTYYEIATIRDGEFHFLAGPFSNASWAKRRALAYGPSNPPVVVEVIVTRKVFK